MNTKRLLGLIAILAATAAVLVTSAFGFPDRKPTTITVGYTGTCQVTGTYTWSGWGGRPRSAIVEILDFTNSNTIVATNSVAPVDASGSVSVTFSGTSGHNYSAQGWLTDTKGNIIYAAENSSGTGGDC